MSFIELKKRRAAHKPAPADAPVPQGDSPEALAVALLPQGQAVLVAGLAPWGRPALAAAIAQRAKSVAVIAAKPGEPEARAFGKKGPLAHFSEPDWAERLGEQRFDAILVAEPLTHAGDPLAFLRHARGLLKPDGAVVALVPNVAYGETRLALLRGEFPGALDGTAPLHHYTHRRLHELFALAGFRLVAVSPYRQTDMAPDAELATAMGTALTAALGTEDDVAVSHFALRAVPATAEVLLAELFAEQDHLRKLARQALAQAQLAIAEGHQTHDALTHQLTVAEGDRARLRRELADANRAIAEAHQTISAVRASGEAATQDARRAHEESEAVIRRLGQEAEDAHRELATVKRGWLYRLSQTFRRRETPQFAPLPTEPAPWIYESSDRDRGT